MVFARAAEMSGNGEASRAAVRHIRAATKPTDTTGKSGFWRLRLKQSIFAAPTGQCSISSDLQDREHMYVKKKSLVLNALTELKLNVLVFGRKY